MNYRRQFIKKLLGFLSGAGLLFGLFTNGIRVAYAKAKKIILPKGTQMDTLIRKNPANLDTRNLELTPVEEFETMGLDDHQIDLNTWQLEISGRVRQPMKITYSQVVKMPSIERNVLLVCPGVFAYHARWKGISVAKLLENAGQDSDVTHVTISGPEGTQEKKERFPIEDIRSEKVFLAYSVNGGVLAKKHGFPLRVVAEGYYGDDWVKYVYRVSAN